MNFLLLAGLLTLASCVHNAPIIEHANDFHAYSLRWNQCNSFAGNTERASEIFYLACLYAGFDENDIMHEITMDNVVYTYYMMNDHGYAKMNMHTKEHWVSLDWGGDGWLDFVEFISFFSENLVTMESDDDNHMATQSPK
jgi:hypothetical protein